MAVAALRELFSVGVTQLLQPPRDHGVPKQCEALVAVLDGHDHVQLQAPVVQEELAVHVELSTKINTGVLFVALERRPRGFRFSSSRLSSGRDERGEERELLPL